MDYEYEISLSVPMDVVFKAITTSAGIGSWWVKSNAFRQEGGDKLISLDFGNVKKLMKVQRENPSHLLEWLVVDCTLREWPGTRIVFNLSSDSDGSSVLKLTHVGLRPQLECFESCCLGWRYFMGSLKKYVETGAGPPY